MCDIKTSQFSNFLFYEGSNRSGRVNVCVCFSRKKSRSSVLDYNLLFSLSDWWLMDEPKEWLAVGWFFFYHSSINQEASKATLYHIKPKTVFKNAFSENCLESLCQRQTFHYFISPKTASPPISFFNSPHQHLNDRNCDDSESDSAGVCINKLLSLESQS